MQKAQPIIIIKKKRHAKHGHHGGAWKVAYADFVTAMMAFFLVMWLINTSPQVKSGLASYFREPGVFELTSGGGAAPGASMGAFAGNTQTPPVAATKAALEEKADEIRQALESMPEFQEIKDRVEIEVTPEGLRIEMIDAQDESFFPIGSTEMSQTLADVLGVITVNVREMPNKIAIEGHTDARPYGSGHNYSNWELSSGRANAARRVLEASGLDPSHLEALHGYGSSKLKYTDLPFDARNRRIAIVLLNPPPV